MNSIWQGNVEAGQYPFLVGETSAHAVGRAGVTL